MSTQLKCSKDCFIFDSANDNSNMMLNKDAIYNVDHQNGGFLITHLGGAQIWINAKSFDLLLKHQILT